MASKLKDAMPNPAQIRGDIQRGLTGDKRPGFDPAMAPLETDSEAGGVPLSHEQISTAMSTQAKAGSHHRARNFDVAMGSSYPGTHKKRPSLPTLLPLIVVLVVVAAAVIGVLLR